MSGGAVVGHYRGLNFAWTITCDDPSFATRIARTLAALEKPADPDPATYDVTRQGESSFTLTYEGSVLLTDAAPGTLLEHLQWHINQQVVETTHPQLTALHCAGVSREGVTVLLPAASGSGKSTLAAALVRAGWDYLSDEAIALDPETLLPIPYPKPITLEAGSWPHFPERRPDVEDTIAWLVPVSGPHLPPPRIGCVVFPQYAAPDPADRPPAKGEDSEHLPLAPQRVSPGEMVLELAQCTFQFNQDGCRHLPVLAALARDVPGRRLTVRDLDTAVAAIEVLARSVPHA